MFSATERPSTTSSSWYIVAMPSLRPATGWGMVTGSPVDEDLALVGLVRAGEDLDQRGLAGAVLAEQAVHLAGADLEVDAVERSGAGELLHDAAHLQQHWWCLAWGLH